MITQNSMGYVHLSGSLTIEEILKIYDTLQNEMIYGKKDVLFLTDISQIDLTFIQLLYSLYITRRNQNKNITIIVDDPSKIHSIIEDLGFNSCLEIQQTEDECLYEIRGKIQ